MSSSTCLVDGKTVEEGMPHVKKEGLIDLVARVGRHVYSRNGVLTELKSFGTVQLGYGIRKLSGRYYQFMRLCGLLDVRTLSRFRKKELSELTTVDRGSTHSDDNDGHTQYQQGAAVLEQGRQTVALAFS
ncbi:hypothetical protein GOBAR_AA05387 [Gossypium barbadense]|uniref:Uncharacterized protein n=1 Tax=Gossypium barbadense TaxID=3634 RepID=A0A2P5YHW7_GOSBA|nr:hypothetical protein GOBAR_AA05387 [Gossypium barbadense]